MRLSARWLQFAAFFGFAVSSSCALAATNIVVNGSFEANNIGNIPWTYLSSVTGWTSTGEFEIEKGSNAGGWSSFNPADAGGQYLEINSTQLTTVSQSLSTTKGSHYDLSFDYSGRSDTPGNAPSKMAVYWNGTQIAVLTESATSGWQSFTFDNLVASGGHSVLSFQSLGPTSAPSYGSYLDNVVVHSVSAVPEPGTYAMLIAGLAMLAYAKRRRQQ